MLKMEVFKFKMLVALGQVGHRFDLSVINETDIGNKKTDIGKR